MYILTREIYFNPCIYVHSPALCSCTCGQWFDHYNMILWCTSFTQTNVILFFDTLETIEMGYMHCTDRNVPFPHIPFGYGNYTDFTNGHVTVGELFDEGG